MTAPASMTVFIPLAIRKRNGRPTIVPPAEMVPANDSGVAPHVLKAIARAWSWRRKLESGAAGTIQDLARAEDISDRYVGRMLRLAYLAPAVLEKLLVQRAPPAVSISDMTMVAELRWSEQDAAVFGQGTDPLCPQAKHFHKDGPASLSRRFNRMAAYFGVPR